MSNKKFRSLEDVYAQVPVLNCKGLCGGGCTLIPLYPAEADAIREAGLEVPSYDESKNCCSALVEGRCTIYEHRPLICRLYGNVAPKMKCQYGCKPLFYLTDKQTKRLFEAVGKFSGTTGGGAVVYRKGDVLAIEPAISLKKHVMQRFKAGEKEIKKA